jgi:hypothetical protein
VCFLSAYISFSDADKLCYYFFMLVGRFYSNPLSFNGTEFKDARTRPENFLLSLQPKSLDHQSPEFWTATASLSVKKY